MKQIFVVATMLFCTLSAWSQPDAAPGMAQILKVEEARANPPAMTPEQFQIATRAAVELAAATRVQYIKHLNPGGKLDLSSPENSVRSFVWSFWSADFKTARQCVKGAQPYEKLLAIEGHVRGNFTHDFWGAPRIILSDFDTYLNGETAIVTLRALVFTDAGPTDFGGSSERFYLSKVENNWLILPYIKEFNLPLAEEVSVPRDDLLVRFGIYLTNPDETVAQLKLESCQANLKEIGLGMLMFVQDAQAKFNLNADWKNQIMPYIKSEIVFHCPDTKDKQSNYAFNSELENQKLDMMNVPSQVIMVYEGQNKEFEFRHTDKTLTNIAFADGHVKAYSRKDLDVALKNGRVKWKP